MNMMKGQPTKDTDPVLTNAGKLNCTLSAPHLTFMSRMCAITSQLPGEYY